MTKKSFKPRKRFGQHFLTDNYVLQEITNAIAPQLVDHLVEIGPGQGVLTELLITRCNHLDLIEIDRDLIAHLQNRFADQQHLTIHNADALAFDFHQISKQPKSLRVVGNLPYNISTPLLFKLFSTLELIKDMYFLLQKEVVQRLTAEVGTSHYGRLSVMSQCYCDSSLLFEVPPAAFKPPPKVDSAFISMIPHHRFPLNPTQLQNLSRIVREAFSYRRKTLGNALRKLISADTLNTIGIDPSKRPQQLSVADYIRIAETIQVE